MTAPPPLSSLSPSARRAGRLVAYGAVVVAAIALSIPICPFAAVAHVPCPGCGLTRATLALAHGRFEEAVRLHPLSPLVSPLLGGLLIYGAVVFVRHGRWPAQSGPAARWVAAVGIALWTLLIGVWLLRFQGAFGGPVPV